MLYKECKGNTFKCLQINVMIDLKCDNVGGVWHFSYSKRNI